MTAHADWQRWSEDYRTVTQDHAARRDQWRRRVGRQGLVLRLVLVSEIVLSTAMLWLVAHTLSRRTDPPALLWAGSVLLLLVVVWVFALFNRSGTWSAYGDTTAAFLALARKRCRRRTNAVRFTWVMLCLTAPLNVVLLAWRWSSPAVPSAALLRAWVLTSLVYAAFIAWAIWYGRRTRRELAQVEQALAEVESEVDPFA